MQCLFEMMSYFGPTWSQAGWNLSTVFRSARGLECFPDVLSHQLCIRLCMKF